MYFEETLTLLPDQSARLFLCTCASPHPPKDGVARIFPPYSNARTGNRTRVCRLHCNLNSGRFTDWATAAAEHFEETSNSETVRFGSFQNVVDCIITFSMTNTISFFSKQSIEANFVEFSGNFGYCCLESSCFHSSCNWFNLHQQPTYSWIK